MLETHAFQKRNAILHGLNTLWIHAGRFSSLVMQQNMSEMEKKHNLCLTDGIRTCLPTSPPILSHHQQPSKGTWTLAFPLIPKGNALDEDNTTHVARLHPVWYFVDTRDATQRLSRGTVLVLIHTMPSGLPQLQPEWRRSALILSPDHGGHSPICDLSHALAWGGRDLTAGLVLPWSFPCSVTDCDATTTRATCSRHALIYAYCVGVYSSLRHTLEMTEFCKERKWQPGSWEKACKVSWIPFLGHFRGAGFHSSDLLWFKPRLTVQEIKPKHSRLSWTEHSLPRATSTPH